MFCEEMASQKRLDQKSIKIIKEFSLFTSHAECIQEKNF